LYRRGEWPYTCPWKSTLHWPTWPSPYSGAVWQTRRIFHGTPPKIAAGQLWSIFSKSHFSPSPQKTESLSDIDLLQRYTMEWENYCRGVKIIDRRFAFWNKSWVAAMRNSGRKDILPVYKVCISRSSTQHI
jgi:hypothetical protein